jgi:PEP-CTERM/exosortase A-associated glycosyltransferase
MKILHILDHYKPHFSGYVFRSSYILKHQQDLGIDPVIVTSPKQGRTENSIEEIDGIINYRTGRHGFENIPFLCEWKLIKALERKIIEVVRIEKQVRAFWEDAAVDHRTFKDNSFKYRISRLVERVVFRKVQALFTICEGLKKEIASRGIPEIKITVIPNSVDSSAFYPVLYDEDIAGRYGLKNKTVYGYIGSFYHYEGIDLLIDAFSKMLKLNKDIVLLLVGDGPEYMKMLDKVEGMNLKEGIVFTGRVAHEQVMRHYSVMDILVYPRKKMRLTELVTPLKPLEAMAMGKMVVGSDVGGIKELIENDRNGMLFEAENVDDLIAVLSGLRTDNGRFNEIVAHAKERVRANYSWQSAVERYIPVYTRLINSKT